MYPKIKNYTIIREIGSGGMAVVYEAVDTRLQRTVALKVLHPHLVSEPTASDRFIREARAAAKIDHPNVVRIFDFGSMENLHYIVMEYVPGTNMERVLKVRGAIRPQITMEIMHEIAEALSQAHGLGIIHRDIKPANILLHKQGRAMLSDFGLAHHLPDPRLTTENAVAGTPSFMSPEQIGGETVTAASDIYSWGVCFYTLLTGKLPYRTQQFPEIIEEIHHGAIVLDPVLMTSLPSHYHDILSRCLAADSRKRIKDAPELMRQFELLTKERPLDVDLRSLCGDLSEEYDAPKTSPSVTSLMTKRKLKRFPFRTAMVAMGILALVIIGALFTTRRLERTGIPKRIAPRSQRPAPIAGALKAPARLDRRAAHDTSAANARQVAKLSGRTIKKQAPVPPVEDSLQALLDSFNVLSPEPSGARGSLLKETALPSPAAPKADKKASAPSDSGRLFVYCDPWATVYADDRELGTTPFKSAVSLPAGVHIIKLTNSFCTPLIDTVTVSADTVIRKRYHLEVKQ